MNVKKKFLTIANALTGVKCSCRHGALLITHGNQLLYFIRHIAGYVIGMIGNPFYII